MIGMTTRPGFTIRLDPDIRAAVDAYAARTNRSVNYALNQLVELGLGIDADRPCAAGCSDPEAHAEGAHDI
jgi:predicted transcriptional regulator